MAEHDTVEQCLYRCECAAWGYSKFRPKFQVVPYTPARSATLEKALASADKRRPTHGGAPPSIDSPWERLREPD